MLSINQLKVNDVFGLKNWQGKKIDGEILKTEKKV